MGDNHIEPDVAVEVFLLESIPAPVDHAASVAARPEQPSGLVGR